jgi:hypothetical protein
MAVHSEFDASEFTLGAMFILLGRNDHQFVGMPVGNSQDCPSGPIPARHVFMEDMLGSLELGKYADVVVWDRDL